MKKFLYKVIGMSLLTIGVLGLSTFINYMLSNYDDSLRMKKNINTLILGDSHTKYALNDNILNDTYNLSQNADSYFDSYLKLKQVDKINPQLDTVFLSFSQHNIHKCIENRWLLNPAHLRDRLKLYTPFLGAEECLFLLEKRPEEFITGLFNQIQYPINFLFNNDDLFGGYDELEHNILKQEIENQKKNGIRQEYKSFNDAPLELKYLKKIVKYCNENNITLILINPPLHKSLQNKQDGLYKFYKKNFSNIPFLDFSKIAMKDSCFGDMVHLNPSGSKYFSKLIKQEDLFNINHARAHNFLHE
ncbi:hypothetical protein MWU59_14065 [Flavobacteriaceae bacterium F08102]|nr:hypothetical protein [Flavobacteriaceae bacterium F08102]